MGLKTFEGEELRGRYWATALVDRATYGLPVLAGSRITSWLPQPDAESIGGRLYVTSLRVAFVAHPVNRLLGTLSIPLTGIVEHRRWRRGLSTGVEVVTHGGAHRFLNWSGGAVMRTLDESLLNLGPFQYTALGHITSVVEAAIASHPGPEGYLQAAQLFQKGEEAQAFDIASVVQHRSTA